MVERGETSRKGLPGDWSADVWSSPCGRARVGGHNHHGAAKRGTATETVTMRRDLNGRDAVSEKVVTHRARTQDEERVVVEPIYRWNMPIASR